MLPGNDRAPLLGGATWALSTSSIAAPAVTASRAPGIFRPASSVSCAPGGPTRGRYTPSIETRRISELQTLGSHET